jgi:thioredoxin 1
MLAPTVAKIAEEKEGQVKVCKLDVDEVPAVAQQYGISSIPTLMVFKNGAVVHTAVGVQPKAAIEAMLA